MIAKLKYLPWSLSRIAGADTNCPSCPDQRARLVKRKYTTALYRCPECELMFRVPKDDPDTAGSFYESEYDYAVYISLLEAAGIRPGNEHLRLRLPWGYGSWQLTQAGYDVYSYKIAPTGAQMLSCRMVSPENPGRSFDCFFSAHVLEHLNCPREVWQVACEVLRPDETVVTLCPTRPNSAPGAHNLGKGASAADRVECPAEHGATA